MTEPIQAPEGAKIYLVDGFNVLHAGVLRGPERRGWREEPARRRLLEVVRRYRAEEEEWEIWVIFDGQGKAQDLKTESGHPLKVLFAPDADAFMVEEASHRAPAQAVVVSSDRRLRRRAAKAGARLASPLRFLARCGADRGAEA